MKTDAYLRPREKLHQKGLVSLSNFELLQLIIGSGNSKISVFRIARSVEKILRKSGLAVGLADLINVPGLGSVKAGQIIAGIELATRLLSENEIQASYASVTSNLCEDVRSAKTPILLCAYYDGADRLLDDHSYSFTQNESSSMLVRTVFSDALVHAVSSVRMFIGCLNQSLEPTMHELSFARDAYKTSALLHVSLKSITLVGHAGQRTLIEESYG